MKKTLFTPVEQSFFKRSGSGMPASLIPYIVVDNFPNLGLFTALRFLEWVAENEEGVISLPTGKTPEFFIKWTQHLLQHWEEDSVRTLYEKYELKQGKKPRLDQLQFVQLDEFYPISGNQHNSFYNYVNNFYIKGFGLNPRKAMLIHSEEIPLPGGLHFSKVFPDGKVDLSLRFRECRSHLEELQQTAIYGIDRWCMTFEEQVRDKGGIGFFLGGIGPDGHIAFNTRGSDFHSTTRLTATNFETQAVAATDLGGIEVSSNRMVITIGLETITFNPQATAIIIAAGESKAGIIQQTLESKPSNLHPASALHKLPNARFYLTEGAAMRLAERVELMYREGAWTELKTDRAITGLCKKLNKYAHNLMAKDLQTDPFAKLIPGGNENTVVEVTERIKAKIARGMQPEKGEVFLHTGPHHDDIMLGILPHIADHFHEPDNEFHFAVLTSGFTAVTNRFVIQALEDTLKVLEQGRMQMVDDPDFFDFDFKYKRDKDIYHYLTQVAGNFEEERIRAFCHRLVRAVTEIWQVKNKEQLEATILDIIALLRRSYDGEKNPPNIQQFKGMIREFEEELVWAHYGVQGKNVTHSRLGFYKGDIFTEQPDKNRDVIPVLDLFRRVQPTVLSLTFDPEGSGPDTHYKVLQTTADALREWKNEQDLSKLRIWGYRNVWFKFNPADANVIVPVSLNAMDAMDALFTTCYLSQVEASFPSYELNGKFSKVAQKIWVNQLKDVQLLLGKEYFYQNPDPRLRACHGLIFYKEMTVDEFLSQARELRKTMEGMVS